MFPHIKETIRIGDLELNFLLDGDDTEGTLVQFELIVPPNAKVPAPHFHVGVDETLYMLEGTIMQTIGTEIRELQAGDHCFIKKGVVHGFNNQHNKPARALCTLSPASIGPAYFREIAAVIGAGGPPDMQKILSIMKTHGLEPVKPALA
ncbi:cupin domain-containing protein [Mucilaginibacter sp. SP1R1]|uniref:cupin domain-containing protein n=1 Tax=Mucilaginibacter sp. SP1R1 TaxID=2723091 RepID=UPI00161F25F9|nr:cupin domain-containing protein [Mucilaginibacter sp. SP1R1]MBB6150327.1 mannose-6-phosphate isomerase-like protein (cupin superfamily) [Mucilaginibacter sp. SP1R1]